MSHDPAKSWKARHFAAANAEATEAEVALEADALVVRNAAVERRFPYAQVVVMNPGGRTGPVQLELRGERIEALVVSGAGFLAALRSAGARAGLAGRHGHGAAVTFVTAVGVLGLAWIVAMWIWGMPMLAGWAAGQVPHEWERAFGESSLAQLAPPAERVRDPRITVPVESTLAVLLAPQAASHDTFLPIVVRKEMVNAFALPGGAVVVTTGLLRALHGPDELAAVLGHEITHVTRRHAMRQMISRLGVRALIGVVLGDQGLSGLVGGAAGTLTDLSYSRKDETEADDGALQRLAAAGIDPAAADRALAAIESAAGGERGPDLSFLSTHPGTEERRARVRRLAAAMRITPRTNLPTREAWRAMEAAVVADSVAASSAGE